MGLDVSTFNYLRVRFEEELQLDKDIGRPPSVSSSSMLLGLTLHYLNSSMMQKTLCQLFGMPPASLSRWLWRSMIALHRALKRLSDAAVKWPSTEEIRLHADSIHRRWSKYAADFPKDTRIFAMMDGSSFPVAEFVDSLKQVCR
jgi:hypothetical protein